MLSFNRTSMELKPDTPHATGNEQTPFNRTSMELKHRCRHQKRRNLSLLIEPVWN